MSMMQIEVCTVCSGELEASQIGKCDECQLGGERDHEAEGRYADEAINRFVNTVGISRADALSDLLESMMHWSLVNGFDFNMELDRATSNFLDDR